MRPIQKPVTKPHGDREDKTVTAHPAYGVVGSSRISGGGRLFQSDFSHQYYRVIRIQRAELHRHLSNDWVHSTDTVIEVAMSEAQWNHFITNPNQAGTPCTIEQINHEMVPGLPRPESRRHQFKDEAAREAKEAFERLDHLLEMLEGSELSQAARKELIGQAEGIRSALQSSLPFILEQFEEHMEEAVAAAKIEVDAYTRASGQTNPLAVESQGVKRIKRS